MTDLIIPRFDPLRFWRACAEQQFCVVPLVPGTDQPLFCPDNETHPVTFEPENFDSGALEGVGWTNANVRVLCGRVSTLTALRVTTLDANAWVETLELPETPTCVGPQGRIFLFEYHPVYKAKDSLLPRGVDILNDCDTFAYPGSVYNDGRTVFWEVEPSYGPCYEKFPLAKLKAASGAE